MLDFKNFKTKNRNIYCQSSAQTEKELAVSNLSGKKKKSLIDIKKNSEL